MGKKKLSVMPHNNLAVFYCGTNGAGKSTLRSFNQDTVQIVIDSDNIAAQINPSAPRQADFEAGREAVKLFRFAINNRISFSMESTLSGNSILQRIRTAKIQGFYVRLNYVAVNHVSINLARVAARVKSGGHPIDENTIRQRYKVSQAHLLEALPFCDEVLVYDNSTDKPHMIFFLNAKNLFLLTEKLPEWCRNLQQELHRLGYISV